MTLAFIIEDERMMAECAERALESECVIFSDAVTAMSELSERLPDVIFLDILLNGPNGLTFLNELASYSDTARIPVVVVTSLDLRLEDLRHYGVVAVLQKETMTPQDIRKAEKIALEVASNA